MKAAAAALKNAFACQHAADASAVDGSAVAAGANTAAAAAAPLQLSSLGMLCCELTKGRPEPEGASGLMSTQSATAIGQKTVA
jgi:hypothetical protein